METLGDRIKRLREQRRWTQGDLALRLGVSARSVGNWENGRNDPRNAIGALEKAFGVSLGEDPQVAGDPVEAALAASELVDWRQDAVRSIYRRNLYEQRNEVGLA